MRCVEFAVCSLMLAALGCGAGGGAADANIAHDFTTPEGAILCLEDAYRARDLEAAVACKDFTVEAKLMLNKLQQDFSEDQEILTKTAEVLELGFRSEMTKSGFPDFNGIVSTFSERKPYQGRDDLVEVMETCRHATGESTRNRLVVAKTAGGWKVISVVD
jgi:hypothetical protein